MIQKNRSLLIIFPLILLVVSYLTWRLVSYGQKTTLEYQAIEIAEIIARQASSARSVYSSFIVEKLRVDGFGAHIQSDLKKGYVPLPAQFLKMFGREKPVRIATDYFTTNPSVNGILNPVRGSMMTLNIGPGKSWKNRI